MCDSVRDSWEQRTDEYTADTYSNFWSSFKEAAPGETTDTKAHPQAPANSTACSTGGYAYIPVAFFCTTGDIRFPIQKNYKKLLYENESNTLA